MAASLWVVTMLAPTPCPAAVQASADDGGGPRVLLLVAAGVAAVSAVMAALAWIGWRTWQARSLPPAATPRAAPPDVTLEWAAEIEWHREPGGASRFCIVASSTATAERAAVSESETLGWPPTGDDSIEALKHAVEQLESGAVAAGWTPAPAGRAWYAKRFTWHPDRGER